MRGRVVIPIALALAVALGLILGVKLPGGDSASTTPAAGASTPAPGDSATPDGSGSPSAKPSADPGDGSGVEAPVQRATDVYPITKLKPGEKPPQFVVVTFDGACKDELWKHYLKLAQDTDSKFTFFLSGLCLVPDRKRFLYKPPRKPAGTSAIGFGDAALIPERIQNLSTAYNAGHEIGTHFLGHFCDAKGVGSWNKADWTSEITQARKFLDQWAEINGSTDPNLKLPFDSSVWQGDRTPCLAGKRSQMYPVFAKEGFTYDASNPGSLIWPKKIPGYDMWSFPLQRIKVVGYGKSNLSMDYNLLYVQNGGKVSAPPATCARIEKSTYQSLMQALAAVDGGNRAPFFVGNHFNTWACGAYKNALTRFVTDAHAQFPDVRFVTNEYLVRWLDAQDPKVVKSLQKKAAPSY
ncbi:MAG: hypothetical protein U0S36_09360 [Candidatus Nanopelagicales bacterium]